MDEYILMQYDDPEAKGRYRTSVMPSGNQYEYTGMINKNRVRVHPMDVAAMEAIGFSVVDLPKENPEQIATLEAAAQEVQAVREQEQRASELVAVAVDENAEQTTKSSRRK